MISFLLQHKSKVVATGLLLAAILSILLLWVFPGDIVLESSIKLGNFEIRFYGLLLILAATAGYFLAQENAKYYGLPKAIVESAVLYVVIGGFIGARLYHVFTDFELYQDNIGQIFAVWNGGLSIFGAALGGFIGLWLFRGVTKQQESLLRLLDWLAPSVLIGQIIGRFGNLFNYEAYGKPTELPWKMFVPVPERLTEYLGSQFFHPLFLYEALAGLLLLPVLLYLTSHKQTQNHGLIFGLWLSVYGLIRFLTEFLRVDLHTILSIRVNFIAAGLMVVLGIIIILYAVRSKPHEERLPQVN